MLRKIAGQKLKFFAVLSVFLIAGVAGNVVYSVATVKLSGTSEGSLIKINGLNQNEVVAEFQDTDRDGFADTGEIMIKNEGDFSFKGRIVNLEVRSGIKSFISNLTGNGIWLFYLDSDSNGKISVGDILIGKVKIMQGSSSLEGDAFTVASNSEKKLKISLLFEPYASEGNYEISFEIVAVYETHSNG
jgi:hypothetical protein